MKTTIILLYKWRIVIYLVILCCLYIFLWCLTPSEFVSEFIKTDEPHECVADRLKPFAKKIKDLDAFIIQPENTQSSLLTFTGNGFIGCSFQEHNILIHNNGFLSQSTKIPALITLDVHGYVNFKALLLDIRDGLMHKMSCFKHVNELCVSSGTTVYAHRRYPSLLIQTFRVYNPMDWDNTVKIDKGNLRNWTELVSLRFIRLQQKSELKNHATEEVTYQIACGLIHLPMSDNFKPNDHDPIIAKVLVVVVYEPVFPENLTVLSGSAQSYTFITGIRISDQPILITEHDLIQFKSDLGHLAKERTRLESLISSELMFALSYPESELRKEHTDAWNFLWTSGITISHSYAPGAVNAKDINTTLYYIASNSPDLLSTQSSMMNHSTINEYKVRYKDYNQCFRGTYTLETNSLWQPVTSLSSMHNLIQSWRHILIDGGCEKLLRSGVYGVHQAVLRSIGSFYVGYDHISFDYPTDSLYRDILFRRIHLNKPGVYANFEIRLLSREGSISSPHLMAVELSVWRSPSLTTLLSSSLSNNVYENSNSILQAINFFIKLENDALNSSLYVCPAACYSTPVLVKSTRLVVPFTVSIPPTALMYLGTELGELKKYSQTLRYVKISPGPAPRHDIITLHRHGHAFGGLPWLFWISLVLLIAIFHMFFCKIIYNELRNKNQRFEPQNSWKLPRYASDLISSTGLETKALRNTQISRRRVVDLDTVP
ncbi:hypothetical protein MS3_00007017 [Schistosoma haematobium]|uniref:Transmembrane protein n=3 Tax=Schistosoma haematobium TaxID=6185 RepID=A0A922ISC4_SCHHA|nr:hypothetical protein MS3_00007017 [Schistosoma haematobium]KAH9585924.1 hypothetical protein MS3_00007017 [Schistosoma haematobium]CAH8533070.1 unnamed protein product [Schistosoma haematobium]